MRLVGAVVIAFVASMALTWVLHARMTQGEKQGEELDQNVQPQIGGPF